MNRREMIACLPAAIAVPTTIEPGHKYGPVDVDRWWTLGLAGHRVFCNEVEVTHCIYFDDTRDIAIRYVTDADGHCHVDVTGDGVQTEVLFGTIEVRR